MNSILHIAKSLEKRIFSDTADFDKVALEIFHFQAAHCKVYSEFITYLNIDVSSIKSILQIPFLPIGYFKSHKIICDGFLAETVFESSGTTGSVNSKHFVSDTEIYKTSFLKTFESCYGTAEKLTIFGLLPSYLEKGNSSLVYMVNELIARSADKRSNFFMHNYDELSSNIKQTETEGRKCILLGVTYALLDFAEQYPSCPR